MNGIWQLCFNSATYSNLWLRSCIIDVTVFYMFLTSSFLIALFSTKSYVVTKSLSPFLRTPWRHLWKILHEFLLRCCFIIFIFIFRKKDERRKAGPSATSGKTSWKLNSKDLYESLDDLKRLRPLVQPNSNFMRQLVKWEADVSKTDLEPYNPYDFFSYQVLNYVLEGMTSYIFLPLSCS